MFAKKHSRTIIGCSLAALMGVAMLFNVGKATWTFPDGSRTEPVAGTVVPSWGFAGDDYTIVDGRITGYDGDKTDVVIPSMDQNGNPVTEIGDLGLSGDTKTVKIPSTVTKIDENAFNGATSGTTIYFDGTYEEFVAAGGETAVKNAGFANAQSQGTWDVIIYIFGGNADYDPKVITVGGDDSNP